MNRRVGIVVVSHSPALAQAALALSLEMVSDDPPPVEVAAGTVGGGIGTDATAVAESIAAADQGAGVVVLMDLGSAVLSAEMALEFIDPDIDARLIGAPFVEGLLAATVQAAAGATIDEVVAEAERALSPKHRHLGVGPAADEAHVADASSNPPDASATTTIVNRDGIHARPAAQVASIAAHADGRAEIHTGDRSANARSALDLAALGTSAGDIVEVRAWGDDATTVVDEIVRLIDDGFGEPLATDATPDAVELSDAAAPSSTPAAPVGVSPGRAIGPVRRLDHAIEEPALGDPLPPDARSAEATRLADACASVADELRRRAMTVSGQQADVIDATALIAEDPAFAGAAQQRVLDDGLDATRAIWDVAEAVVDRYTAAGGRLAERVTDVRDLRNRVVELLRGVERPSLTTVDRPQVLIAEDLAPADTVGLDHDRCAAIVTVRGGPTSHTAIIARELGIPAVVGATEALRIDDGTEVLVDGTTGEIIVEPGDDLRTTVTARVQRVPLQHPGGTADGRTVGLLANIAGPDDTASAIEWGAEGIGLFRTELCFLDRTEEPSLDEQLAVYRSVLGAFPGQKVVIRILDAGSDKPLPFLGLDREPNPSLGVRGYRHARRHPEMITRQLDAIASAAAGSDADAWVMAPMIATLDEAEAFVQRARAAGIEHAGVMIETPAAAALAAEICAAVDFVSIGTNDLTQYTMAADRQLAGLADLMDPWHPAVLRAIGAVGAAGSATGTPVGVCGEAASDPTLAPILVGLGVTSLSMSPRLLASVGDELRSWTLDQCTAAATAACAATSPSAARAATERDVPGTSRSL